LGLPPDAVSFAVNVPLAELRQELGRATAGMHSMWNEHFGIGVVEMMAAGVLTVAHDSGGPRSDIVVPWRGARTGFLATTPAQYADALQTIFAATSSGRDRDAAGGACAASGAGDASSFDPVQCTAAARASVARFTDDEFSLTFFAAVVGLLRDGFEAARRRRVVAGEVEPAPKRD